MEHFSVMKQECIENLNIKNDGIYIDATLGRAGHASEILKKIPNGLLVCFDLDQEAINKSDEILKNFGSNFKIIHSNYSDMQYQLQQLGITHVDGILMDLGVSSPQFDDASRGFSYRYDSRLDMRMDTTQTLDAHYVVNHYEYDQLMKLFFEYGEEKFSKQIAKNIIKTRAIQPINTTLELVNVIKQSLPEKVLRSKGHPAKKVFQAIRIEVNKELENLEIAIRAALKLLSKNGRLCVITFHSLEDKIVKRIFKECSTSKKVNPKLPMLTEESVKFKIINKKVIVASEQEIQENNRSHSAKLRVIERVEDEKESENRY